MDRKIDSIDAPSPLEPPCEQCGLGCGVPYRVTLSHTVVHVDVRCTHCAREWQVVRPREGE